MERIEEPMAPVRGLWKLGLFFGAWMLLVQVAVRLPDGFPPEPEVLVSAGLGAIASALLFPWLMGRQYRPTHGAASIGDREAFEAAARRRIGLYRPRIEATSDGFRLDGSTWILSLPPVVARYEGEAVRFYGPGALVKHLLKAASNGNP